MDTTEAQGRIFNALRDAMTTEGRFRTMDVRVYESPDDWMEFEVVLVAPTEQHLAIHSIVRWAVRPYKVNFVTLASG